MRPKTFRFLTLATVITGFLSVSASAATFVMEKNGTDFSIDGNGGARRGSNSTYGELTRLIRISSGFKLIMLTVIIHTKRKILTYVGMAGTVVRSDKQ